MGTHVNVSHLAATPSGQEVIARVRLTAVDGRRLTFEVEGHDEQELISSGTHERFVIDRDRFDAAVLAKSTA